MGMQSVCTRDCFHCPYPDCIVDDMDADERVAHRAMEKDLMTDPDKKRIAAYRKAYYEANREEIAAYRKAYYEANREEIAARNKAYYEANREEIAAYRKAYYEANREEIAARNKAYREANREEYSRIGKLVRNARKAHGYTQSDLGRILSVSRSLVALWETGCVAPPLDKLVAVLPELGGVS